MNIKKLKYIIITLILSLNLQLYGDEISDLLNDIEIKTDLSQKTQLENSGVSFIYTRDDIDRMQITNLKDILKSVYPVGYNENNFGVSDPFTVGSNHPFVSSKIRLYIDNQELTSGFFGSSLSILGNANIDWVDHIEIYTQSPTYEYATEATITLIKLYTKSVTKDEGGKVKASIGSYDASSVNAYYADYINDWSYFVFSSLNNDKRKKYYNHNTTLSRDKEGSLSIATLHKGNTNILLGVTDEKRDGFIDISLDASPEKSTIDFQYIHIGADTKIGDFSYLLTYSYFKMKTKMLDDVTPIPVAPYYGMFPLQSVETSANSMVLTGEVKYTLQANNNKLITGLKYRTKRSGWNDSTINGISTINNQSHDDESIQNVITAYIENQYSLQSNSILTTGIMYSQVSNEYSTQDDDFLMYRLGYTYTNNALVSKTIYSHTLVPLEPYLVNSTTYLATPTSNYNLEKYDTVLENIIYEKDENKYELILDYTQIENMLFPNLQGKFENYNKTVIMSGMDARWTNNYNRYDKLFINIGYRKLSNLPIVDNYTLYSSVIRNVNTYKKFDIFNELVYNRNDIVKKDFFDYSLGIKYNYSRDFTISLKGTNLFNKAKTTSYYRVSTTTFTLEAPLEISPIDQTVMLSVEYVF